MHAERLVLSQGSSVKTRFDPILLKLKGLINEMVQECRWGGHRVDAQTCGDWPLSGEAPW